MLVIDNVKPRGSSIFKRVESFGSVAPFSVRADALRVGGGEQSVAGFLAATEAGGGSDGGGEGFHEDIRVDGHVLRLPETRGTTESAAEEPSGGGVH